jgi:hypothetical protein
MVAARALWYLFRIHHVHWGAVYNGPKTIVSTLLSLPIARSLHFDCLEEVRVKY